MKNKDNNIKMPKNLFNNKFFWLVMNGILVFIVVALFFWTFSLIQKDKAKKDDIVEQEKVLENEKRLENERLIDGVLVEDNKTNLPVVSLMIDNHFDARPVSGLREAKLVYEAEVEGRITRYLAFFTFEDIIEKIGPVRSARPYFVDWANEMSAVYGHCGGSPEALVKITKDGVKDLNEFYNGVYFWRDENGVPSHNLYTSSENLKSYLNKIDFEEGTFLPWLYKDDLDKVERATTSEIRVGYLLKNFNVKWRYDMENNNYIRYLGSSMHRDSNRKVITAKNVIVQVVDAEVIDDVLRLRMENIGTGDALVCLDGKCNAGIWKKTTKESRTRFYNEAGEEFKLNRGNTWINVVRPDIDITLD